MTAKRLIPLLLLILFLLPSMAQADALTPQKTDDIKYLFKISKIDAALSDMIEMSVAQGEAKAEKDGIELTPEVKRVIRQELSSLYRERILGSGGLFDQLVPVYAELFTHQEIKQYIAFYKTPLGKKIAATTSRVTNQAGLIFLGISFKIGQEIPIRVLSALQREGLIPQTLPKQEKQPEQQS